MKFLAIETELEEVKAEQIKDLLRDESKIVLNLYERGIIREIYFNQSHCAVIILECNSLSDAKGELNKLPLVKRNLIQFEISELNPYTGFSRLSE